MLRMAILMLMVFSPALSGYRIPPGWKFIWTCHIGLMNILLHGHRGSMFATDQRREREEKGILFKFVDYFIINIK